MGSSVGLGSDRIMRAGGCHAPAGGSSVAFFFPLGLRWSSSESGDLWYKPRRLKMSICYVWLRTQQEEGSRQCSLAGASHNISTGENSAHIRQSRPDSGPGLSHASGKSLHTLLIDSWRGTTRAENAQGTPTQSYISPSILVYGNKL